MNNRHGNRSFVQHTTTATMSPFDSSSSSSNRHRDSTLPEDAYYQRATEMYVFACVHVCLAWCETERMKNASGQVEARVKQGPNIKSSSMIQTHTHTHRPTWKERTKRTLYQCGKSHQVSTRLREWESYFTNYAAFATMATTHTYMAITHTHVYVCVCVCSECTRYL